MLSFLLSYLLVYKYSILFGVIALASFGIPFPATPLLLAAGAFAAQGYFNLYSIFICGFFASVLGDIVAYTLSLRYGRSLFMRIGLKRMLLSPKFHLLEELFAHHSRSTIFLTRFLATGLGPGVNILAGIAKIPYKKFLLYVILGQALYVIIWASLGYIFGDQWEAISSIGVEAMAMIVLMIVLVVLLVIIWRKGRMKDAL